MNLEFLVSTSEENVGLFLTGLLGLPSILTHILQVSANLNQPCHKILLAFNLSPVS